jgi:predicted lipid-binding transport protein (Tim44 family)
MNRSRGHLHLKCLTAAVAVALLAAPTVQAAAAGSGPVMRRLHSVTAAQHVEANQVQPNGSGKSSFWSDAAIAGGVLAGILVLGLWGDVAIGGLILGLQLLCAGAALCSRKVVARAREASRRTGQVAESDPAASSR